MYAPYTHKLELKIKTSTIVLLFTLFGCSSRAHHTPNYRLAHNIMATNAAINKDYARVVARHIIEASDKYGIDPKLFTAILLTESGMRLNAVRICWKTGKATDFGIGQIHAFTAETYGFSKQKLLTDLRYSIFAAAKVLNDFKKLYGKKEPNGYYLRYNCGTKRSLKRRTCLRYKKKVTKMLRALNDT